MSNSLYIFDFDDTLVDSGANVKVIRADGTEELYSSREYRDYDRKHKQPGDILNFDEFDVDPPDASVIQAPWSAFITALNTAGPQNVMILTARANPDPVKEFLIKAGVNPLPIIEAVGDSDPNAKKRKVAEYIERLQIIDIYLWEDSPNNIRAIESLANEIPGLTFFTKLVTETVLRRFIREILSEVLWKK
jgi:hypothetical protein